MVYEQAESTVEPATPTSLSQPHADGPGGVPDKRELEAGRPHKWRQALGFQNIGAVYVLIAVAVVFTVWAPVTFPTVDTVRAVLNQNAITAMVALSLVIPLAAGVFDLSVAHVMGATCVLTAWLLVEVGWSAGPTMVAAMSFALLLGIANGIVVVKFKIHSFIATLATASLIEALIVIITDNMTIIGPAIRSLRWVSGASLGGLTAPILYTAVIATGLWFLLERTGAGRSIYAVGFAPETARLTGIRTERIQFASLVASSAIAGFAGIVITATVSAGSPSIGPPYLLPAFAAVFVGATQLKSGRFNAWGTVLAVVLLGTGSVGLMLVGVPQWAPSVFVGVALILALGLAGMAQRARG